jgi:hypothetical protein
MLHVPCDYNHPGHGSVKTGTCFRMYNFVYKDEMFVWNWYKFTFLNRSEPDFAHIFPLVWRRSSGIYGPTIFDPFRPSLSGASAESWSQDGCRPKSHPRQRYIRIVADDTCALKCLALGVMHRERGEVNGMRVCKYGNLMRQEGSE